MQVHTQLCAVLPSLAPGKGQSTTSLPLHWDSFQAYPQQLFWQGRAEQVYCNLSHRRLILVS